MAVKPRDDQFLWWVHGHRCAVSFEREIPETPQNDQAADQPQRDGEEGDGAGFYPRAAAEKYQRNIEGEQTGFEDEVEQGFINGHEEHPRLRDG